MSSNGKVTCVYHAVINNNERTDELKRIKEQDDYSMGVATYDTVCDVIRKMHMTLTEKEIMDVGYKVINFVHQN